MNCPICIDVSLAIAERHGIEIDYCPKCRGIWLDRGEIDKMVEHFAQMHAAKQTPGGSDKVEPRTAPYDRFDEDRRRDSDDDDRRGDKNRKRRGGFLENLMDILD